MCIHNCDQALKTSLSLLILWLVNQPGESSSLYCKCIPPFLDKFVQKCYIAYLFFFFNLSNNLVIFSSCLIVPS